MWDPGIYVLLMWDSLILWLNTGPTALRHFYHQQSFATLGFLFLPLSFENVVIIYENLLFFILQYLVVIIHRLKDNVPVVQKNQIVYVPHSFIYLKKNTRYYTNIYIYMNWKTANLYEKFVMPIDASVVRIVQCAKINCFMSRYRKYSSFQMLSFFWWLKFAPSRLKQQHIWTLQTEITHIHDNTFAHWALTTCGHTGLVKMYYKARSPNTQSCLLVIESARAHFDTTSEKPIRDEQQHSLLVIFVQPISDSIYLYAWLSRCCIEALYCCQLPEDWRPQSR